MIGALLLEAPDEPRLRALRLRLDQLSPRVTLRDEPPYVTLLIDLGRGYLSDGHRHGAALHDAATTLHLPVTVGVAPAPTLAWLAARRAQPGEPLVVGPGTVTRLLHRCPLAWLPHLAPYGAACHGLGFYSLGALASLPPAAVAGRFGPQALVAWRLLHGEEPPLTPVPRPPRLRLRRVFDGPVGDQGVLSATLQRLASRLAALLQRQGAQARALTLHLHGDSGIVSAGRVLEQPAQEAATLFPIAVGLLAAAGLGGTIERLDLLAGELVPLRGEQLKLFPTDNAHLEAGRAAVVDLAMRLGPSQLLRPSLVSDGTALAEERGRLVGWGTA